ncbi:MAG: hypothetical protein UIB31_01075 [Methanobrevibacter sp.]|uniref:hypothetical protein n=1 Tax=Methanobrevibacter sp. TaxID=66852 RepID=UPI002E775D80|nr:hypothetical protein [Methanobrevibacter sp.]MEE0901095.1 hypothetical protein [Methanobrevibacter sp.]MEE0934800.1 hypothetical protein [Methanobrevibacter sp.]
MALNLSPEKGVKLTKKDRAHVLKKIKQGWKATCLIPDYIFDDDGNIQIGLEKNRRIVRVVKILDDGIHIEKALKTKTLRIKWEKIASINSSKEVKDGLEIQMRDGRYVTFSIYNSYKIKQNTEFIANYIAQKSNERN